MRKERGGGREGGGQKEKKERNSKATKRRREEKEKRDSYLQVEIIQKDYRKTEKNFFSKMLPGCLTDKGINESGNFCLLTVGNALTVSELNQPKSDNFFFLIKNDNLTAKVLEKLEKSL